MNDNIWGVAGQEARDVHVRLKLISSIKTLRSACTLYVTDAFCFQIFHVRAFDVSRMLPTAIICYEQQSLATPMLCGCVNVRACIFTIS